MSDGDGPGHEWISGRLELGTTRLTASWTASRVAGADGDDTNPQVSRTTRTG